MRRCKGNAAGDRRFGVVQVTVDLQFHADWLLEMCGRLLWRGIYLIVEATRTS